MSIAEIPAFRFNMTNLFETEAKLVFKWGENINGYLKLASTDGKMPGIEAVDLTDVGNVCKVGGYALAIPSLLNKMSQLVVDITDGNKRKASVGVAKIGADCVDVAKLVDFMGASTIFDIATLGYGKNGCQIYAAGNGLWDSGNKIWDGLHRTSQPTTELAQRAQNYEDAADFAGVARSVFMLFMNIISIAPFFVGAAIVSSPVITVIATALLASATLSVFFTDNAKHVRQLT